MRSAAKPGAPIVVKVGSSSLVGPTGGLDDAGLVQAVDQVMSLRVLGYRVALVSSGSVAAGLPALNLSRRPSDIEGLQVAAAVGQARLMEAYNREFDRRGVVTGQVLLTKDILGNRSQYLHARRALERMLAVGVVPIVNENDTVVVDELKLGDNDRLAAIVSHLVGAGMLILLTDTVGLYSGDPRFDDDAELLTAVRHTDEILDAVIHGASGSFGSGGVATKVSAARMAAWSGIPTVVAAATEEGVAAAAATGRPVGTWVEPHMTRLSLRKLWIAFGQPSEGTLHVDDGAFSALVDRGKSLLPAGIVKVDGSFGAGVGVEVVGPDGDLVGKGIARMSAGDLRRVLGEHSSIAGGEAVHRDDLVILRPVAEAG